MSAGPRPPTSAADAGISPYERIENARRASLQKAEQRASTVARALTTEPLIATEPEPVVTVTLDKIGSFLELDFRRLFTWLRAGLLMACLLAIVGGIAGGAYALLAKQRYTVTTDILINPGNLQVIQNDLYPQSGQIDSQILSARSKQRVLTSNSVLSRVVDELELFNDPEFYNPKSKDDDAGASKPDPKLAALRSLQTKVKTTSDDKSFVTTLSVTARTAEKAVEISQKIAESFQEELASTEASGAKRAAAALDARLGQLKDDVQAAEEKVEAYRRSRNLSSSNGQLVSSQTMTQLNGQIVEEQARAVAAKANLDALVASGINGSPATPEASGALAQLRERANGLRQQIDSQAMTLGPRHPVIVRLRTELGTVDQQLRTEYARTVEQAKADLNRSRASLASLNARMNDLKGTVFDDNESEVTLRELLRDAASKSAIYESFLSRARQITEREQIDTTNVQVISMAVPPNARSWPPSTPITIGLGAVAGFVLGMLLAIAWGILRDMRNPPNRLEPKASLA